MSKPKAKDPLTHLVAGGTAGLVECSVCHPLDTIKTRMQLRRGTRLYKGPFATGHGIIQREGFFALYKGLTAVATGIVPKMAIRFMSFEAYKTWLGQTPQTPLPSHLTFVAGLAAGVTEAVLIVTPFEVCKIRLQAQFHSLSDPEELKNRKYRNVVQTAYVVGREEGISALWKGVGPTLMRQGINQAVNFTAYQSFKNRWLAMSNREELSPWQHFLCGGVSGALGPIANCPLDVVKTRLQKQVIVPGEVPKYTGMVQAIGVIAKEEGVRALWKGLEPRLMRIVPGQAMTFMVYEKTANLLAQYRA